jgi:hypothetical protein
MYTIDDLYAEAQEAGERVWFVQSMQSVDRTDQTISLRLNIRTDLFVHVLLGELTGSLYFALIEQGQRIFGIDRHSGEWHMHPYEAPFQHVPFPDGLEPKPLLSFLSRVEDFLIQHDLL